MLRVRAARESRPRCSCCRVGLVGGQRRLIHGQRVERSPPRCPAGFGARRLHRALVGERCDRADRTVVVVFEQLGDRGDVRPLARRRRARSPRAFSTAAARLRAAVGPRRRTDCPNTQRDAPVGNGAGRILGQHGLEAVDRRAETRTSAAARPRDRTRRPGLARRTVLEVTVPSFSLACAPACSSC